MVKYLVIAPAWLGDLIMAQALFIQLKCHHDSTCQIHVVAAQRMLPVLDRMLEVDKVIVHDFKLGELNLRARYRLAVSLRAMRYDHAIILPNSYKSALLPYWARIPQRTGWVGEMRYGLLNDIRKLDKHHLPQMVQRFVALGQPAQMATLPEISYPCLTTNKKNQHRVLQDHALEAADKQSILALCPGARFGISKQWLPAYYAQIAQWKLSMGWQVCLFGDKADKPIADQIVALTGDHVINWVGRIGLGDTIDLLSLVDVVVTNDSGLMHLACALGRSVVAVYGSTSPLFTPPLSVRSEIVALALSCRPCFQRMCPLGHLDCMHRLTPQMVMDAVKRVAHVTEEN